MIFCSLVQLHAVFGQAFADGVYIFRCMSAEVFGEYNNSRSVHSQITQRLLLSSVPTTPEEATMPGYKTCEEFEIICQTLTDEELQLRWQHYTRALASSTTSTVVALVALGPTQGISVIGVVVSGPFLYNAFVKRRIVGRHIHSRGIVAQTRKRDIFVPIICEFS